MRRVWINPPSYNIPGDLRLEISPDTELESVSRRVTRTATLDGGAVAFDTGYSAGDRIFVLRFPNISQADSGLLQSWVKTYSTVYVTTLESTFYCVPEEYSYSGGVGQLRALVLSDVING